VRTTSWPEEQVAAVTAAFHSSKRIEGLTHGLYHYPAQFPPDFVRSVIHALSAPHDLVLDPFMGGGSTAVEALAAGRRFMGFDINPLSLLVTEAKTTPLPVAAQVELLDWLEQTFQCASTPLPEDPRLRNAPPHVASVLAGPAEAAGRLVDARSRVAARAVLLSIGQWALEARLEPADRELVQARAIKRLQALLDGLDGLQAAARSHGLRPWELRRRRTLRMGAAANVAATPGLNRMASRVKLLLTSPPYPGVHVLYHRWQVHGRRETALPYWLADAQDGFGPKHYTMGGRSRIGQERYFSSMATTWRSLRRLLREDAVVVQLVAFADAERQLPRYKAMMAAAGFAAIPGLEQTDWRRVPNRRWYNRIDPERAPGGELLIAHVPIR